jgi:hypothetical protein
LHTVNVGKSLPGTPNYREVFVSISRHASRQVARQYWEWG